MAWFPGKGEGAEGSRNVFGELRACGGVDGVWGGEAFEGAELGELGDDLFWEAERGAKEDLGRPAPGQGHEAHAFFQIAVAGQEVESFLDEGLPIQRDQVGLVLVDALVVSGIERAGFFWRKSEVGKTLAGAHLSGAQDEVVRVDLADSVAVLGEIRV